VLNLNNAIFMNILNDYTLSPSLKTKFNLTGTFQTEQVQKSSKIVDFFEQLYSYPQKISLKWGALLDAPSDPFSTKNEAFDISIYKWDPNYDTPEEALSEKYLFSDYSTGLKKKINSSNFYSRNLADIFSSLSSVPIFAIINGENEIVTSKAYNSDLRQSLDSYLSRLIYDYCGAFDLNNQNRPDLGLFFFDKADAENYLKSIAKTDIDGTKTVGLTIHSIGLDSAYKLTREYHPNVDFRFLPKLTDISESDQKRIDGVPIYLVDLISETKKSKIIFFDKTQATEFYKKTILKSSKDKKIKTKFCIDSFENFLEKWEEQIHAEGIADKNQAIPTEYRYFVPSTKSEQHIINRANVNKFNSFVQAGGQKIRTLKRVVGTFFSVA